MTLLEWIVSGTIALSPFVAWMAKESGARVAAEVLGFTLLTLAWVTGVVLAVGYIFALLLQDAP